MKVCTREQATKPQTIVFLNKPKNFLYFKFTYLDLL